MSVEPDGDVLVITIRNPPINAGSLAVRRGVLAGIARLSAEDTLVAGVIIGGGTTIIDAIAEADLREAAVSFARGMRGKRRLRDQAPKADAPEAVEAAVRAALQAAGEQPWVKWAIDRVLAAQSEPIDEALTKERALFQQYRQAPEAAALRHLFFAEREAARQPTPAESRSLIGKRVGDACRRQCERMVAEGAIPAQIDRALQAFGFAAGRFGREEPGVRARPKHASVETNIPRREITDTQVVRRALMAMANEAAHLLSEGTAARASAIDVILVHERGFPRWEGGPACQAQRLGRDALEIELDQLAAVSGAGFRRADTQLLFGERTGAAT